MNFFITCLAMDIYFSPAFSSSLSHKIVNSSPSSFKVTFTARTGFCVGRIRIRNMLAMNSTRNISKLCAESGARKWRETAVRTSVDFIGQMYNLGWLKNVFELSVPSPNSPDDRETWTHTRQESSCILNDLLSVWNVFAVSILKVQGNCEFHSIIYGFSFLHKFLPLHKFLGKLKFKQSRSCYPEAWHPPGTPLATLVFRRIKMEVKSTSWRQLAFHLQFPCFSTSYQIIIRSYWSFSIILLPSTLFVTFPTPQPHFHFCSLNPMNLAKALWTPGLTPSNLNLSP